MEGLMGPSAKAIPDTVLDDIVRRAEVGPRARLETTARDEEAFYLDDRLHEIVAPVDLIWGLADQLYPLTYAKELEQGLAAVRLTTLPDCGHIPQRECPIPTVEALLQILDQGPPEPRLILSSEVSSEIQETP